MVRGPQRGGGNGGNGDSMMPPPFSHPNQAIANYFNSDDAPFSEKLVPSQISHQKLATGQTPEYSVPTDSAYGTNSVRGRQSSSRSLYNGSNASTMSTVGRLNAGLDAFQIDTRSEASLSQSELNGLVPWTGDTAKLVFNIPGYGHRAIPEEFLNGTLTTLDVDTDMFSTPDINNDSQSVTGGQDDLEIHYFQNSKGYHCKLCQKGSPRVTKTRSEMLKHIRTHIKPYKCTAEGCNKGFANEGDLKRHHTSCHKDIRTLREYYMCPYGACEKKQKPWTRWDNMKKHIQDVHGMKAEDREIFRVKNTGPQDSDLAGIGLPLELNMAPSPMPDIDGGTIDLDNRDWEQLMSKSLQSMPWTSISPTGSSSSMSKLSSGFAIPAPPRIMPSKIRGSRSVAGSEFFGAFSERPTSPQFSFSASSNSSQISSSAPISAQHRRSGIFSTTPFNNLSSNQLQQLRLQQRYSARIPAQSLERQYMGHQFSPRTARLGTAIQPTNSKRDRYPLSANLPDLDGFLGPLQQLSTRRDSVLFHGNDPWTPINSRAVSGRSSKSATRNTKTDGIETGDTDRDIQLEDGFSEVPIDDEILSVGGANHDETGFSEAAVVEEIEDDEGSQISGSRQQPQEALIGTDDSRQPPVQRNSQEKRQGPQESQELQEPQQPQESLAAQQKEDARPLTVNCSDLTVPGPPIITAITDKVAPRPPAPVALGDDIEFDTLSDDRLQTVLKRLKKLADDGDRLKSLGFALIEIPVTQVEASAESENTARKEETHVCPENGCASFFTSKSALRKHAKRHERPFACTFSCAAKGSDAKAFGSKNDWKRHEEGLHFQAQVDGEEWQCDELLDTVEEGVRIRCHDVFKSSLTFQTHLVSQHKFSATDKKTLREKTARYRAIPRDKGKFWCGFCEEMIQVKVSKRAATFTTGDANFDEDGNLPAANSAAASDVDDTDGETGRVKAPAATDQMNRHGYILFSEFLNERFNHIDNHFVGRGTDRKTIADWMPDNTSHSKYGANKDGPVIIDKDMVDAMNRIQSNEDKIERRKRHRAQLDASLPGLKRSKSKKASFLFWICHECKEGVNFANVVDQCPVCSHRRCNFCSRE